MKEFLLSFYGSWKMGTFSRDMGNMLIVFIRIFYYNAIKE